MCEPGKPCPPIGVIERTYPLLWFFFDGAFSANSGGHVSERDFKHLTVADMERAEKELSDLCMGQYQMTQAHHFGMLADSGYTVWGPTMQDRPDGKGDDDQHKLKAYELLDTRY